MTRFSTRRRLALAGIVAAATIGAAAPAHADAGATPGDCDVRLERLQDQFYAMADRRDYEAASEWWQARWQAYFQSCVIR
jgi:hypothetical protein